MGFFFALCISKSSVRETRDSHTCQKISVNYADVTKSALSTSDNITSALVPVDGKKVPNNSDDRRPGAYASII